MTPYEIEAPAKLNLSLRVLGRRDDGFHEIDTWMVTLPGLADRLVFDAGADDGFTCDDESIPAGDGNLVVKARQAFEKAAGLHWHGRIHLEKRIPHGAGLGGGSSDAAAVLKALNGLCESPLPPEHLRTLAAEIGSDVPFFLSGGSTRCQGRGEIASDAPAPPAWKVLLLKPSFGVATPDAYGRWAGAARLPGVDYGPAQVDGIDLVNDLEVPVFGKHRFLAELKEWLRARSETRAALMCGSGSTIFAVLDDAADGEQLARRARHELDPGLWHWCGRIGG